MIAVAKPIKTIKERVAELLAEAPPLTDEEREIAVRLLVMPPSPVTQKVARRRSAPGRAA